MRSLLSLLLFSGNSIIDRRRVVEGNLKIVTRRGEVSRNGQGAYANNTRFTPFSHHRLLFPSILLRTVHLNRTSDSIPTESSEN
ncbi:hypothetical protein PMAYCL1PPCAC_11891, partial [Pristionchus mayeri]